jgi:hypothetical protein
MPPSQVSTVLISLNPFEKLDKLLTEVEKTDDFKGMRLRFL